MSVIHPHSLVLMQACASYTCSCWGRTEQQNEWEPQSIFSTVHHVFCSEVQVSVTCELMTAHCSCWEYFLLLIPLLQLSSFTPFPPIAHSQPHSLIPFLVLFVTHLLIQMTQMVENYSLLSRLSSLLHCLHKCTRCGARQVPEPVWDGVAHTAVTGEKREWRRGEGKLGWPLLPQQTVRSAWLRASDGTFQKSPYLQRCLLSYLYQLNSTKDADEHAIQF